MVRYSSLSPVESDVIWILTSERAALSAHAIQGLLGALGIPRLANTKLAEMYASIVGRSPTSIPSVYEPSTSQFRLGFVQEVIRLYRPLAIELQLKQARAVGIRVPEYPAMKVIMERLVEKGLVAEREDRSKKLFYAKDSAFRLVEKENQKSKTTNGNYPLLF